jgi:hypothetical protein
MWIHTIEIICIHYNVCPFVHIVVYIVSYCIMLVLCCTVQSIIVPKLFVEGSLVKN